MKGDYINESLKQQLIDYDYFCRTTLNCTSVKTRLNHEKYMLSILEWMHREDKVLLEELCFKKIILLVQINPDIDQPINYSKYLKQKEELKQKTVQKAEQTKKHIEPFFE